MRKLEKYELFFANCSRTEIKLAIYLLGVILLQHHSAEEKALLKPVYSLDFIIQRTTFHNAVFIV